jgi:hypothetical protein
VGQFVPAEHEGLTQRPNGGETSGAIVPLQRAGNRTPSQAHAAGSN